MLIKPNQHQVQHSNVNQNKNTMKYIISLSLLLLGTNAVRDNDEAFRVLRGFRGVGGKGQGMHGGGGRNSTDVNRNRTEMLLQMCADNDIVCSEVSQDFLDNNCTLPEPRGPYWDRDLVIMEEVHDEDRFLRGGPGRGRGPHGGGPGGGRWGNLTEAEREDMRLKHLTCRCCKDDEEDGSV